MNSTLVMLLAGGVGSRLDILAYARAKPAVPFGGVYRIIDFTLSNVMNSGMDNVGVLTQYKPLSLMQHIGTGEPWDFIGRTRGAKILPPRTGEKESDWYKGTADAVRQNIDFIENRDSEQILILSGDHIYRMDYSELIKFHRTKRADFTIGMMLVPWEETVHFGVGITNNDNRIVEWEEKPEKAHNNLASMGIYVFNTEYLLETLRIHQEHDFGKNIIPAAIELDRVYAYPFDGYWRDVGTINAYWSANMDLLDSKSGLDLKAWHVRTRISEEGRLGDRSPTLVSPKGSVINSIISPGCRIMGYVENSILSPGVFVGPGARIVDSVVMHDSQIMASAEIIKSILDKNVIVGENTVLGDGRVDIPNREKPHHLSEGLVVVGKGVEIPTNCRVGKNCILQPGLTPEDYPGKEISPGETVRPRQVEE
ncbi:glucose-1-phosphate adenylyltransferase [candidate division KSB1 bacterium]|nr:glucose-1-phosphate adenylyltransferase [candidate division KSB1 bacterium]NIR73029.1 glucose-1-phosphate adenylyltransferase [candidate division KSB1 bacterium]NIS23809.1 glucose-1-phosphate adenylyltransferase [candidate division KSB1 bacterium]NIT70736.1 glucose-1-phosphate adenylyltransferase [candidate division KSB1 bacterium]NIU24459.1 glucose-1-phosphate adenylyltransferase [candidate division KSB1 bacterium]